MKTIKIFFSSFMGGPIPISITADDDGAEDHIDLRVFEVLIAQNALTSIFSIPNQCVCRGTAEVGVQC